MIRNHGALRYGCRMIDFHNASRARLRLLLCQRCAVLRRPAAPLAIGYFPAQSTSLGETRRSWLCRRSSRIGESACRCCTADAGCDDFLHVAGLVQVSVGNGTMRPFVLVGIENTERRRDLSGPTQNEEDRKIAPRVVGSATFRKFLRDELMPDVRARYRTTDETAIVGESLAGLFVIETFLLERTSSTATSPSTRVCGGTVAHWEIRCRALARAIQVGQSLCSPAASNSAATGSTLRLGRSGQHRRAAVALRAMQQEGIRRSTTPRR